MGVASAAVAGHEGGVVLDVGVDALDGANRGRDGDEPAEDVQALQPDPLGGPLRDLVLHDVHLDLREAHIPKGRQTVPRCRFSPGPVYGRPTMPL